MAQPLLGTRRVTLVAGGSGDIGVSRLPGEILDVVTRLPAAVEALTGVSVTQVWGVTSGSLGGFGDSRVPSSLVPALSSAGCPEEVRLRGLRRCHRVPKVSPRCHHPLEPPRPPPCPLLSPKCHHVPMEPPPRGAAVAPKVPPTPPQVPPRVPPAPSGGPRGGGHVPTCVPMCVPMSLKAVASAACGCFGVPWGLFGVLGGI